MTADRPDTDDAFDDDLPEQMKVRRAKYDRLMDDPQRAPFPVGVARTSTLAAVREAHPDLEAGVETGETVGVTGRVIFVRNTGKLCFAMLREGEAELQVMLSLDRVGQDALAAWKADVDLGDLVFVRGEVIASKRGELSVLADSFRLTAKALRPLPVAHKPLSDEMRVRQRYVDLIVRPEARKMVRTRATVLRSLRETFHARGYVEVETPVLQVVHGGAAAGRSTRISTRSTSRCRCASRPSSILKRCIVGGIERVFEIGPAFRNEGVDSSHSPEYTLLEAYESYGDYDTMAELTRGLVVDAADAVGVEHGLSPDGTEIDLRGEWRTVTVFDVISEALGEAVTVDTGEAELRRHAERVDVGLDPAWGSGEIVLELYEKLVEHHLQQPTFVRDYPVAVRPLARPHRDDPRLSEAWDLVIGGVEIAPAYSELVDPVEQRRRLVAQSLAAAAGDPEAMELDEDFLRALEYGMPPTGGLGMGVDRLVMILSPARGSGTRSCSRC